MHGSDTASLTLDDVEVPDATLMGQVGDGFKIAMSALDPEADHRPRGDGHQRARLTRFYPCSK